MVDIICTSFRSLNKQISRFLATILLLIVFLLFKQVVLASVVCPSGTAGQGGCDYIGGDGIQQAVDAAPVGTASYKTTINIKNGNYSRQGFTEVVYPFNGRNFKGKCLIATQGKYLVLEGETNSKLDGTASVNMTGICVNKGGAVEIKNLTIIGFKYDDQTCNGTINPCSRGIGIDLFDNSQATITNNIFFLNTGGILLDNNSQATITNNTLSQNTMNGIFLEDNSSAVIVNNISTFNPYSGFAAETESFFTKLKYNLAFGNGTNSDWGFTDPGWPPTSNLTLDPKFINNNGDFHLQHNSPAKNAGDPSLKNPDGTRSDIGVYGGPGATCVDPSQPGCTSVICSSITGNSTVDTGTSNDYTLNGTINSNSNIHLFDRQIDIYPVGAWYINPTNCGTAPCTRTFTFSQAGTYLVTGNLVIGSSGSTGNPDCNPSCDSGGVHYVYQAACQMTVTVKAAGGPTLTPTPTTNPNCNCSSGSCATACTFSKFDGVNYSNPIKCSLDPSLFSTPPTTDEQNTWCKSNLRTKGDADGNGTIDTTDYFYYVRVVNGGKVPGSINADFNGDGEVGAADRTIIMKSLNP